MFKMFGAVIFIGTFVGAFFVARSSPELSFAKIIGWSSVFIVLSLILVFGFNIYSVLSKKITEKKEEMELPEPMAREELLDIVMKKALKNKYYMNEVKEIEKDKFSTVGDKGTMNKVFVAQIKALYPLNNQDKVFIIINAHYSSKFMSVLFNPSPPELNSTVQAVGGNPIEKLNVVEREITDDLSGKKIYTKETKHLPKEGGDEGKKKEADIE